MPTETVAAVAWALTQTYTDAATKQKVPVTKSTPQPLVDAVREYFNANGVKYSTFGYADLEPFLN